MRSLLRIKALQDEVRARRPSSPSWNVTLERRVAEQVAQLERVGRLKRFFSPQLAEAIVGGDAADPLKSHRREITVVFLDLRGFTAFTETADPEEVMGVLREYHAAMGPLILAHEGTLERFTGDGIMVFFNDPVPMPTRRRARRAWRWRCSERSARLRRAAGGARGYELGLGVGIAHGLRHARRDRLRGALGLRRDRHASPTSPRGCAARRRRRDPGLAARAAALDGLCRVEPAGGADLKGFHRPVPAFRVVEAA